MQETYKIRDFEKLDIPYSVCEKAILLDWSASFATGAQNY